jgi:hypothetical protein
MTWLVRPNGSVAARQHTRTGHEATRGSLGPWHWQYGGGASRALNNRQYAVNCFLTWSGIPHQCHTVPPVMPNRAGQTVNSSCRLSVVSLSKPCRSRSS